MLVPPRLPEIVMRIAPLLLVGFWPLFLNPVALAWDGIPAGRHPTRSEKPLIRHHHRMPSEGELGRPRKHHVSPEHIPIRNTRHV